MTQKLMAADVSPDELAEVASLTQRLPEGSAVRVLLQLVVEAVGRGVDITFLKSDRELTPNEAAELLKVSRPHLLKLMDHDLLTYRKVGSHRRIAMADLLDYIERHESANAHVQELLATRHQFADRIKDLAAPLTSDDLDELEALSL